MYLSAVVKSSYQLCQKLAEKLKSCEEDHVKLLGTAFSCVLCAIESAQSIYKDEHGKDERAKVLNGLTLTLKGWIALREVIGGSVFGSSVPSYLTRSHLNWKGKQELKVLVAYPVFIVTCFHRKFSLSLFSHVRIMGWERD